jgi:hypothetical protein
MSDDCGRQGPTCSAQFNILDKSAPEVLPVLQVGAAAYSWKIVNGYSSSTKQSKHVRLEDYSLLPGDKPHSLTEMHQCFTAVFTVTIMRTSNLTHLVRHTATLAKQKETEPIIWWGIDPHMLLFRLN